MILVAVTGSIGAGKSTLVAALADRGAAVIDADRTARDVVDPATALGAQTLARIRDLLGTEAITADGALDRPAVATRIFADAQLRTAYDAIIHPVIAHATAERIRALEDEDPNAIVVHEVPLLLGRDHLPWIYDLVVTVEADDDVRLDRLVRDRGHDEQHARERIAAQRSEEYRAAFSDVVVRTDGDASDARESAEALWSRILALPPRVGSTLRERG